MARLRQLGTSVIALDMIFAEPDRDRQAAPDAQFAEILREGGVVLGYGMTFDGSASRSRACVLHPLALVLVQPREQSESPPLFHATGAICSLPMLADAAGASGFLNAAPDADGVLRRVALLMWLNDRVYPGLALAAVAAAVGAREIALEVSNVNAAAVQGGGGRTERRCVGCARYRTAMSTRRLRGSGVSSPV